jgi:hypothetical protein
MTGRSIRRLSAAAIGFELGVVFGLLVSFTTGANGAFRTVITSVVALGGILIADGLATPDRRSGGTD